MTHLPVNLDHNILTELGFIYQSTPHAEGAMVYSRKEGICRGDIFLLKKPGEKKLICEVRIASYWEKEPSNEFLIDVATEQDLKLFYEYALNIKIM